jgi:HIV Tat-specific factor 1
MTSEPQPDGAVRSENAPFPRDPAEFDADPRISFSKLSNAFILEAEDDTEYEFDVAAKRWIPVVCS